MTDDVKPLSPDLDMLLSPSKVQFQVSLEIDLERKGGRIAILTKELVLNLALR